MIGCSQRMNSCRPPNSRTSSCPGVRNRWKVLPRTMSKPSARASCGSSVLMTAFVASGTNAGVLTVPCARCKVAARARDARSRAWTSSSGTARRIWSRRQASVEAPEAMDEDRLKAIPLFAELEDHDLRVIATFADELSVPAGEVLVREGDFAYELMAIEAGTADVHRGADTIATLAAGDVFGEVGWLENRPRSATIVATSPMRLITLSTWELRRMRAMPGV